MFLLRFHANLQTCAHPDLRPRQVERVKSASQSDVRRWQSPKACFWVSANVPAFHWQKATTTVCTTGTCPWPSIRSVEHRQNPLSLVSCTTALSSPQLLWTKSNSHRLGWMKPYSHQSQLVPGGDFVHPQNSCWLRV